MNPDSKLLLKLSRRVREALTSNPATSSVWLFADLPVFGAPSDGLVIEGVRVRHFYPSNVLPPEGARR